MLTGDAVFVNHERKYLEMVLTEEENDKTLKQKVEAILKTRGSNPELDRNFFMIVDASRLDALTREARSYVISLLNTISRPDDIVAVYGVKHYMVNLVKLVIKLTGQSRRLAFFDDRELAEEWLLAKQYQRLSSHSRGK